MKFDMPKAVFCGLALIAAAIFFGPGSVPATAKSGIQKVAICDAESGICAGIQQMMLPGNKLEITNHLRVLAP